MIQCTPGDESGGEAAEDEDEADPRKCAKPTAAGRRARGSLVARELGGRGGQGAWWPDRGGEKYEQEREEGAQESSSVDVYTYICIIYCTCLVETTAVRDALVVRGLQFILQRFPTVPQSTPRRPAAPGGAFGACGPVFLFVFLAHTPKKIAVNPVYIP